MANHDDGYKLLFSHPEMVEDLLLGFVAEDWVHQVDFTTLEKVGGSYVSDGLQGRESDIVWRVRRTDKSWLYIYILLEFQSTVDPYMSIRVMSYKSLLYQDLIRQKLVLPSGKLPPIFAAIFYNGRWPWTAARDVADLVEPMPGALDLYRPHVRYFLLDVRRIKDLPDSPRNLVAALVQLERSRDAPSVARILVALVEVLQEPKRAELHRAFTVFLTRVLLPARMPGVVVPEMASLQEVRSMLEEDIDWTKEWRQKGFEEGLEQGEKRRQEDLKVLRTTLLRRLTLRFGPVPESVREQVDTIESLEKLMDLAAESVKASSLSALGFA